MPQPLIIATTNQGKIRELAAAFAARSLGVTLRGLEAAPGLAPVEETGATFEENALLKARAVYACAGLPALADDSGLVVDALNGAPGIRSARYAGPDATDEQNNRKLLAELENVPHEERTARFVCVLALVLPQGRERIFRGTWEGRIALAPAGSGGFGYDPLFVDPEVGKTAAELTPDEKNRRSHRGRAVAALLATWEKEVSPFLTPTS